MHGRIEDISKEYDCSRAAAAQLAHHIQELEAEYAYARNFINDRCIMRVPKGGTDLVQKGGGGFYSWQFYLRAAFFEPKILRFITNDFFAKYGALLRTGRVQIAGVESAATPMLTAFSLEADRCGYPVNVFSIRKEVKAYGRRNWIEGNFTQDPVIIVDDVVSPVHFTMIHAMEILETHKIPLTGYLYSLLYKTHKPDSMVQRNGKRYHVDRLFCLNDFDLLYEDYERVKMLEGYDKAALDARTKMLRDYDMAVPNIGGGD